MRSTNLRSACFGALLVCTCIASGCGRSVQSPPAQPPAAAARFGGAPGPLPKPPPAKYQRDLYGKLDDCVADWGFAGMCTPLAADAAERAQGGVFLGPIYSNALRFESQLAARREAVEQGYQARLDEKPSNRAIASADIES